MMAGLAMFSVPIAFIIVCTGCFTCHADADNCNGGSWRLGHLCSYSVIFTVRKINPMEVFLYVDVNAMLSSSCCGMILVVTFLKPQTRTDVTVLVRSC